MNRKEIVNKINKILKEQKARREKYKIYYYNKGEKIHLKQLAFHKNQKKNRWVFGGNRTGKTECGAVEAVYFARGIHPYRQNKKRVDGWIVSLSQQVQRDVAQQKFLSYVPKEWIEDVVMLSGRKDNLENGIIDYILIRNVSGEISKIGFKSCDQGREKFQGTSLDFVWFDEEPPRDIYVECKMRVIDKCGDIFGTMTPLKGLTWVYNEIYLNENRDEDIWCEHIQWKDNPFLNKKEIESLKATMSEEELQQRDLGLFKNYNGMVYSEFDENIHVIEPFEVPFDWYDTISIDPGLKNPLSAHWYARDFDDNVYVIAEHYESDRDISYHSQRIKDISNRLNWKRASNGNIECLIDSAGTQKTLSGTKSVVDLFYEYGISANPRVNKDLFAGIAKVKARLRNAQNKASLFIFKNCENMIREIKGYFWSNQDRPVKRDDHSMDELRYYIMSLQENNKIEKKKNRIELDKERIYRKLRLSNNAVFY